ncbi:hypothetical protein CRENBAI_014701 [Crenichthys baileyi]|uniref:Uncharacterized protein n=1 Tax=Crenichthys baileyi TaxID=28760 RepID=A0AAV9RJS2_9TELE
MSYRIRMTEFKKIEMSGEGLQICINACGHPSTAFVSSCLGFLKPLIEKICDSLSLANLHFHHCNIIFWYPFHNHIQFCAKAFTPFGFFSCFVASEPGIKIDCLRACTISLTEHAYNI